MMRSLRAAVVTVAACATGAAALRIPTTDAQAMSRRAALSSGLSVVALGALPAFAAPDALKPCPKGANNCFSTASPEGKTKISTWNWPSSTTRDAALKDLSAVIDGYPQGGQQGVDAGGWSFADDEFASAGYARLEFKSGLGNMAKFFNNNKPFVDDLEFAVEKSGVCVRSSSRVGDSDFGVNAKRLKYAHAAHALMPCCLNRSHRLCLRVCLTVGSRTSCAQRAGTRRWSCPTRESCCGW